MNILEAKKIILISNLLLINKELCTLRVIKLIELLCKFLLYNTAFYHVQGTEFFQQTLSLIISRFTKENRSYLDVLQLLSIK